MSEPTTIKAIVTKYWMTLGPRLLDGQQRGGGANILRTKGEYLNEYYNPKDWQPTKRDATDDVLNRYLKRKSAIKKAMATLDAKRDRALKMIEGMDIT